MSIKNKLGISLSLLGGIALILRNVEYTSRNKAIEMGPLQVTIGRKTLIPYQFLIGVAVFVSGVFLLGTFNGHKEI